MADCSARFAHLTSSFTLFSRLFGSLRSPHELLHSVQSVVRLASLTSRAPSLRLVGCSARFAHLASSFTPFSRFEPPSSSSVAFFDIRSPGEGCSEEVTRFCPEDPGLPGHPIAIGTVNRPLQVCKNNKNLYYPIKHWKYKNMTFITGPVDASESL